MIFAGVWATLVYFPVAAWVWGGGWIFEPRRRPSASTRRVIDYAGGTAVHINAGAAALALALVLGKRVGFAEGHRTSRTTCRSCCSAPRILWFGWFGFNAGAEWLRTASGNVGPHHRSTRSARPPPRSSAGSSSRSSRTARPRRSAPPPVPSPASSPSPRPAPTSTPGWALLLGVVAGAVCALAIELKFKLGFDDSLDVVGIHLVGGLIGTLYLGFFATDTGLFLGGGARPAGRAGRSPRSAC